MAGPRAAQLPPSEARPSLALFLTPCIRQASAPLGFGQGAPVYGVMRESSRRCTKIRSSQRPNLHPTSGILATCLKPRSACKASEAWFKASIAPTIACARDAVARSMSARSRILPIPERRRSALT